MGWVQFAIQFEQCDISQQKKKEEIATYLMRQAFSDGAAATALDVLFHGDGFGRTSRRRIRPSSYQPDLRNPFQRSLSHTEKNTKTFKRKETRILEHWKPKARAHKKKKKKKHRQRKAVILRNCEAERDALISETNWPASHRNEFAFRLFRYARLERVATTVAAFQHDRFWTILK